MGQCKDETGERYGKLVVLKRNGITKNGQALWLCKCDCGSETIVRGSSLRSKDIIGCGCSRKETGPLKGSWKGGRRITGNGYIHIRMPEHHRAYSNGYVPEHILVMEQLLGRPLLSGENIHHKNGNRSDNRLENLELWVTTQPSGQRPADLLTYAREIIDRYGEPWNGIDRRSQGRAASAANNAAGETSSLNGPRISFSRIYQRRTGGASVAA